ncbi:MAG: hypothetical protein HY055_08090 [Magnetospirillum sp.]|nr:hypothetical protein [Magnetospirillum sp.]
MSDKLGSVAETTVIALATATAYGFYYAYAMATVNYYGGTHIEINSGDAAAGALFLVMALFFCVLAVVGGLAVVIYVSGSFDSMYYIMLIAAPPLLIVMISVFSNGVVEVKDLKLPIFGSLLCAAITIVVLVARRRGHDIKGEFAVQHIFSFYQRQLLRVGSSLGITRKKRGRIILSVAVTIRF